MERYKISENSTIRDALMQLNSLHSVSMTLFVMDSQDRMVGTLTDGDIRRALISDFPIDSRVGDVMHKSFFFISDRKDIKKLKKYRTKNILLVPLLDNEGKLLDIIDLTKTKSALPIDAVLMAGGKGERLRPLTLECPKPLLRIGEKSIIDRNIDELISYGINNISVTINYLKEKLIEHFAQPTVSGVKVSCVAEQEFYGTIGALTLVKKFHNDTILVMNSDLLTNIDYEDFFLHFQENDAMMSAAAIPYTISVPYGIFELDGRNIKGVTEKPTYNLYANAGIYLLKREVLKYIPKGKVFNATDLIDTLAANGQNVIRYPLTGLWIDIGTPEEFRKAQELIKHINN